MAKNTLALLLLGAILLIVGIIALSPVRQAPEGIQGAGLMSKQDALKALDNLALPTVDGKIIKLSDWKGKIRVINFWATWCSPCRDEMPAFSRLQSKHSDKIVQFVGISIDQADKIRQFTEITPVNYPLLVTEMDTLEISAALGNQARGLPFTIILDRQGGLDFVKLGRMTETDLESRLQALLRQ
jgi:thiol-disulfide isomerase/thioredoxin